MGSSTISYLWCDQRAPQTFRTGVSLHSHTNQSRETLSFLADIGSRHSLFGPLLRRMERRSELNHGVKVNYRAAYWTPPLTPKLAFDLESSQIEDLDLAPMISITDHNNINAPMLLRAVASAREIPFSVEWSAPYAGVQDLHLGIHNLPSAKAQDWMATLQDFTAHPDDNRLSEILAALNDEPNVMVIFNHPMWDLFMVGAEKHASLVNRFLEKNSDFVHALELNGLRNWDENRAVRQLAAQWNMLLISGGDRHGVEPNANINVSRAGSFTEFVHEIRMEKRSNILFMPQYAEPWKHRILRSAIDAIRDYTEFPQGSRRWEERVYHPNSKGAATPLSDLWPSGSAPWQIRWSLSAVRLLGRRPVSNGLRMAWSEAHELRLALGDFEG